MDGTFVAVPFKEGSLVAAIDAVRQLVMEKLGVAADKVIPQADLRNDLGADSLDAVEIVMALEDQFKIEIPESAAENIKTVGDILTYLESKGVA